MAAISIGQWGFEQWNLDVSALRCVPSGSKSRHFKRQASQEFWSSRDVEFQTNSTTRMTIAGGGDVGIGTAPEAKLHVGGGDILMDNARLLKAKNSSGGIENWMWPRWSDNGT